MLLKHLRATSLAVPLSHTFDTSFKDGVLPAEWEDSQRTSYLFIKKDSPQIQVIIEQFHLFIQAVEQWNKLLMISS